MKTLATLVLLAVLVITSHLPYPVHVFLEIIGVISLIVILVPSRKSTPLNPCDTCFLPQIPPDVTDRPMSSAELIELLSRGQFTSTGVYASDDELYRITYHDDRRVVVESNRHLIGKMYSNADFITTFNNAWMILGLRSLHPVIVHKFKSQEEAFHWHKEWEREKQPKTNV